MSKVQVKFGDWIEGGFNLYKANFGTLVLASIFVVVISAITAGILAGPMLAGLALVTLQLLDRKGPQPEAGRVFKGFDYFLQSLLFVVVWGIGILAGSLILGVVKGVEGGSVFVAHAPDPVLALFEHIGSRGIQRCDKRLPVFTGSCWRQKALTKCVARECNHVEQGERRRLGLCRITKVCFDHTNDASYWV